MKLPLTIIILTYNEEHNIEACLRSVAEIAGEILIVDSYSSDATLDIARCYTTAIYQHRFDNYSRQRNWALETLPLANEWLLQLDADHRVTPELAQELTQLFGKGIPAHLDGFLLRRRVIFLGQWIRFGGVYATYHAILFRRGRGFCEHRRYDQHFVISGPTAVLANPILDIGDDLTRFTARHNRWATQEAAEYLSAAARNSDTTIRPNLCGNRIEQRRFWRQLYYRFPLFFRAMVYFGYRYCWRLGFLDGRAGLIYHLLQGGWFRFLVDAKIFEIKARAAREGITIKAALARCNDDESN